MTMTCKSVNGENIEQLLSGIDTILTDCDGVLWHGTTAIPGAADTIQKLQAMGKKIFYLTNNSTKSRDEYVIKCTQMGFPAQKGSIVGSGYVAAQYVKHQLNYSGKVYVLGSKGIQQELAEVGLESTGTGPDDIDGMGFEEISKMKLDPSIHCVIVGLDVHFNYLKLARAISYLARDKCHFVATNMDSGLPTASGNLLPGTGSLVAAVEMAAQRKPDAICGKPYLPMFDVLKKIDHIEPSRTLMIGDRLNTDIELAGVCGLHSLLVLTGISSMNDVDDLVSRGTREDMLQIPEYSIASLGDLGVLLEEGGFSS